MDQALPNLVFSTGSGEKKEWVERRRRLQSRTFNCCHEQFEMRGKRRGVEGRVGEKGAHSRHHCQSWSEGFTLVAGCSTQHLGTEIERDWIMQHTSKTRPGYQISCCWLSLYATYNFFLFSIPTHGANPKSCICLFLGAVCYGRYYWTHCEHDPLRKGGLIVKSFDHKWGQVVK